VIACEDNVTIPATVPALSCSLTALDTLRRDEAHDRYQPEVFPVSLDVRSFVDTVAVMTARIDLTNAPHLKLGAGESGAASLTIPPRGTAPASFSVAIDSVTSIPTTEVIRIVVTCSQQGTQCSTNIAMQARPSIRSAACLITGHDTVWSDPGNESYVPTPIQMRPHAHQYGQRSARRLRGGDHRAGRLRAYYPA